jgi:hypothetical protein
MQLKSLFMALAWASAALPAWPLTSLAQGAAPRAAPHAASVTGAKAFDAAIAGLEHPTDSLLPVYLDRPRARVLVAFKSAGSGGNLGQFLYQVSLRSGLGSTPVGMDRSQAADTQLIQFVRVGAMVLAELVNTGFRAEHGSDGARRAVQESFAYSTIWSTPVLAESTGGAVLVDLSGFLTRDAYGVVDVLSASKQGKFKLAPALSYADVSATLALPENLEFEAHQTFAIDEVPGAEVSGILPAGQSAPRPAPHSLTLIVHHSLIKLPEPGYVPRLADPRMGALGASVITDFSSALESPLVYRLARRFRLEKLDPTAARSRVKKPIVFYVDSAAPEPVRSALVEGASWWAEAFDAAGFIDAFRVEVLPEGVNPLDSRYNVINWVHRQTRGWSYGDTIVDPRTGEIVKGLVLLGSQRIRQDRMIFEGLVGTAKTGTGSQDDPLRISLARLRQLAVHETGHALGLDHNFAGSTYDDRASAMDYPAPRIQIVNGQLDFTDAYKIGIGSWDRFVIHWLYDEPAAGSDPRAELNAIVADGYAHGARFVTDDDSRPARSANPNGALWDDGADAVTALAHVLDVRRIALDRFGIDSIARGQPLADLRRVIVPVYLFHRYEVDAVAKAVGGVNFTYAVKGDALAPAYLVPASEQRRALDALLATVEPPQLDLPDTLVQLLSAGQFSTPDPQTDLEVFGGPTGEPFDLAKADAAVRIPPFQLQAAVGAAADVTFGDLLNTSRLNRVAAQGELDPRQLTLSELLSKTLQSVFAASRPDGPHAATVRRWVQARLIAHLAMALRDEGLATVAAADVRQALHDLGNRLAATKSGDAEDVAAAHYYADLIANDKLADFAARESGPDHVVPPTGPPIGAEDDWFD